MRHRVIIAAVVLLGLASAAHAQSIAGVVRDESGAVLPGVTVEVSSPALIEKVRSAVTDATGQYRVVSLSPGVYTVTFTLPGFNAVKHDGIELSGTFTATVNADLKVGALEETITVSGTTPLVDVQSVTKQTVITRDVIDALPAARNIQAAAVMIPGVTTSGVVGQSGRDVGGSTKLQQPSIVFRGNPNNIQRWDGFHLGNLAGANTGAGTSFYINDAIVQELTLLVGRRFGRDGQSRPLHRLRAQGRRQPVQRQRVPRLHARTVGVEQLQRRVEGARHQRRHAVYEISDINGGFGGPILRDKLWFYGALRYETLDVSVVDNYYDTNPTPYLYEPDFERPAHDSGDIPNESFRLTWQGTSKDKVQFWFTNQNKAREFYNISATVTPDGAGRQVTKYAQPITLKWTRTQTSRLLLEGGMAVGRTLFHNGYRESVTPAFDIETIQNTPIYAITDISNNRSFGASIVGYMAFGGTMKVGRFATTYVTGSHALQDRRRVRRRPRAERRAQLVHRRRDDEFQQRRPAAGDAAHPARPGRRLQRPPGVRAGPLDARPRHHHRRPPLRLLRRLRERFDAAGQPLERGAVLPGLRAPALARHLAARRHLLRSVRQRQDRAEDERRALCRAGEQRHGAGQQPADDDRADRHAELERSERRLHDLQPGRLGAVGRAGPDEQRQLRQEHPEHRDAGSADAQRLGRARFRRSNGRRWCSTS